MTKIAITIISFFLLNTASSQDFLKIGNQWLFEHESFFWPIFKNIESITVTKDTVIDNKLYFKLEASKRHVCHIFFETEFLREDNNKIYRLSRDKQREYLMIDFDAQTSYDITTDVGWDTIHSQVIVDSIGTTIFSSGQVIETQFVHVLNNQSYEDWAQYRIYKGIGFLCPGLLFPDIGTGLCDPFTEWMEPVCFISNQDTVWFSNSECYGIGIIDAIQETSISVINLSPNPTHGIIYLPDNHTLLSVTNIEGQQFEVNVKDHNININVLPNGIYVLLLKNNISGDIKTGRIVKI